MHRRRLLGLAAGASLSPLAACDRPPADALTAWRGPPPELIDPRRRALAWAVLAPSRCNTQPWQVALVGTDRLELRTDPARALRTLDPDGRQARVALGAFTELCVLALAEQRRPAAVAVADGDGVSVRLGVVGAAAPDPLFRALPTRRTTRLAYDLEKPLPPADAATLTAAAGAGVRVGFAFAPREVAALRTLAASAHAAAASMPDAARESGRWLRLGADEVAAHRDGIAVTGPPVWWATRLGLLSSARLADSDSVAARMARLQWATLFAGTASFGWLATAADDLAGRLAAGRAYQRLDLAAAALGLAIHPVSEALGDVPGLAPARLELERLVRVDPPGRVQMLFRLGAAGPQPPSPRRPPSALLRR